MAIFYHGAHALFDRFTRSRSGNQGFKSGFGVYVTSAYSFAARCSEDSNSGHYVYTVEIPDKTETNHIAYGQPLHKDIVTAIQTRMGISLSPKAKGDAWKFREEVLKHISEGKRITVKHEKKLTEILLSAGVELIEWPYVWSDPSQGVNMTVLDAAEVKILNVEKIKDASKDAEKNRNTHGVAHLIRKYYNQYYTLEIYPVQECARITKVDSEWGILGNFGTAKLKIDGVEFETSEHLFQVMKFKEKGVVQNVYARYSFGGNRAPAKMAAKSYETVGFKREDWGAMILDAMKFCLQTKYDQSEEFRNELERSKGKFIVEDQDTFPKKTPDSWGVKSKNGNFAGPNLLGRLLMELRDNGKLEYKLPDDALDFIKYLK